MLKIVVFCIELEQTKMWTQVVHLTSWSRELYLSNRMCELCLALKCSKNDKASFLVVSEHKTISSTVLHCRCECLMSIRENCDFFGNYYDFWKFENILWLDKSCNICYPLSTFQDDVNSMRRTVMVYVKSLRWWCFISLCFQYEPDSFKKWVQQQLPWKKRGPTIGIIRKLFAGL